MIIKSKDAFPLFLLGFAVLLIFMSTDYPWQAQMLPTIFGIIVILLIVFQLMIEKSKRLHASLGFLVKKEEINADIDQNSEKEEDQSSKENNEAQREDQLVNRKELAMFLWIIFLVVLLYYMPYYTAVPIFLFVFTKFFANVSWRNAVLATIIMTSFMYVLFSLVLNVTIY
jgi:4-amino-4-deoxy-L-arabinose transferase-like glycosyltransferase